MSESKLKCPKCGSERMWQMGRRLRANGDAVQVWQCQACGKHTHTPLKSEEEAKT